MRRLAEYNWLLLESTGDGIFGVDADGRCTFVNRSAASMLGYKPGDLLGRDMHALIHHSREDGTPIKPADCFTRRALRHDSPIWSDDDVLWRQNGECFPVQYSANPIHEDSRVVGAVVYLGAQFSPKGKEGWIAYASGPDVGHFDIYIERFPNPTGTYPYLVTQGDEMGIFNYQLLQSKVNK